MGSGTSIYNERIGNFTNSVKTYQDAVMAVHNSKSMPRSAQLLAEQKAMRAFNDMQIRFGNELKVVSSGIKAKRGTPLTSPQRAINIATSSRSVAKLDVVSQVHAHNLVKLTQHSRLLGNGVAAIDFGGRVGNIKNDYKAGADWERTMFNESLSFAASAVSASLVAKAGAGILTFVVVATPVGWVGLIVGGAIVVGAAAATSIAVNNKVKQHSDGIYTNIMKKMDSLWM